MTGSYRTDKQLSPKEDRRNSEGRPREERNIYTTKMIEKLTYINTSNLLTDTSTIIESAKNAAFRSVNVVLVQRNWLLGKRIAEEQLGDLTREELYGQRIVETLAQQLTEQYGSGFDFSSL